MNEFRYNLPYPEMTGGALSIRSDQFAAINGFSNQFYGWGGEDDEFHRRLARRGLLPLRLAPEQASAKKSSIRRFVITEKALQGPSPG